MPTRVHELAGTAPASDLIERWRRVPVTIASDIGGGRSVLDPRIRPLRPVSLGVRIAGPARTAWCERGDFGPVLHIIDRAVAGEVIVVACDGRLDTAIAGEILCGVARRKGIAALIVDGAVRDIDTIASWPDFPVYCLGSTARGPLSRERGSVDDEIVAGGVRVAPRDLVLADNDGVIVFDPARATALIDAALERVAAEVSWERTLAGGASLLDVFSTPDAI